MCLEVKYKIPEQSWMNTNFIQNVFNIVQGSIPLDEPQILCVGGCVRNAFLGKDIDDIDLATPLEPDALIQILEKEGIKVIPTGLKHGTVTLANKGLRYEVTTLRWDKETDGRHAQVSFTQSWKEDAKRRDFTLNTLLMDLHGNIYDPLGCGLEAVKNLQVRFVGEPQKRIEEDYLRILRFFRFSAYYAGKYDKEGLEACQNAATNIKTLSKERITQEFLKIISVDKPHDVLDVMFSHNVLSDLPPKEYDAKFFEYVCTLQSRYKLQAIATRLLILAALDINNVKAMGQYLLLPKVFLKDMKCILGALNLPDLSCSKAVHESIYRFGRTSTAQALIIELAQDRVMNAYAPMALDMIQNRGIPDFPISGKDLIKKGGMKPGPALGKELERLEGLWIENNFSIDGIEDLEKLK